MVNVRSKKLDDTFHALADPTRRAILARVASGERTVTQLAEPFDMSLAAVSKHLKVLERAGLLSRTREGRVHHLRLEPEPLKQAAKWIAFYQKFWDTQLDALGEFLATMDPPSDSPRTAKTNKNKPRQK